MSQQLGQSDWRHPCVYHGEIAEQQVHRGVEPGVPGDEQHQSHIPQYGGQVNSQEEEEEEAGETLALEKPRSKKTRECKALRSSA